MARAMQIAIQLPGLPQQLQGMSAVTRQLRQMAQAQDALNRTTRISAPARLAGGPMQRYDRAQRNVIMAGRYGTRDQQLDAVIGLQNAARARQRALAGLQGPGLVQSLGTAVSAGRGLAGAGVQGLAAVAGTAAAALAAFAAGLKVATDSLQAHGAARTLSGGTGAQVAFLQALGIPAGEIASLGAGLRERLSSDPQAMAAGARMGLRAMPRPYGSTNEAGLVVRFIEEMRTITSAEERLRRARALQMEAMLPLINISDQTVRALKADAAAREAIATPEALRAATELGVAFSRLRFSFESVLQALSGPAMKDVAAFVGVLADELRFFAQQLASVQGQQLLRSLTNDIGAFMVTVARSAEALGILRAGTTDQLLNAFQHQRKMLDQRDAALGANTRAVVDNTAALKAGMYGGGERAQGAIPGRLRGYGFQRALEANALRMGAFRL